jgi:flavin reductase (DIM6/NTAB) family NADH-FMN oxidoreductase RutF
MVRRHATLVEGNDHHDKTWAVRRSGKVLSMPENATRAKVFEFLVARLNYPMFIVTAATAQDRSGCLVGFVSQASIDPQRLLVCLSKANRTYEVARTAETLVVHFLSDKNRELATLFGEETGDEVDKFTRCEWALTRTGAVVLIGTRGWVEGRVLQRIDLGDHVAHLLDLADGAVEVEGNPLMFDAVQDLNAGHPA